MSIAQPGRRLLRNVPLRFVASKVSGAQRPVTANLSLTSMIDFPVVTVVFLLILFQPGESAAANGMQVPDAINVQDALDAPMITVKNSIVTLDGKNVGSSRAIEEGHQVAQIDELKRLLVAKKTTWKEVNPNKPFPGAVVLQLDQSTPSVVVKSLFHTAALAGYPSISFMVERRSP